MYITFIHNSKTSLSHPLYFSYWDFFMFTPKISLLEIFMKYTYRKRGVFEYFTYLDIFSICHWILRIMSSSFIRCLLYNLFYGHSFPHHKSKLFYTIWIKESYIVHILFILICYSYHSDYLDGKSTQNTRGFVCIFLYLKNNSLEL